MCLTLHFSNVSGSFTGIDVDQGNCDVLKKKKRGRPPKNQNVSSSAPSPQTSNGTPAEIPTVTPKDTKTDTPTDTSTVTQTVTSTDTPIDTPTDAVRVTPTVAARVTPTDAARATPTDAARVTPTDAARVTPTVKPTAKSTVKPRNADIVAQTPPDRQQSSIQDQAPDQNNNGFESDSVESGSSDSDSSDSGSDDSGSDDSESSTGGNQGTGDNQDSGGNQDSRGNQDSGGNQDFSDTPEYEVIHELDGGNEIGTEVALYVRQGDDFVELQLPPYINIHDDGRPFPLVANVCMLLTIPLGETNVEFILIESGGYLQLVQVVLGISEDVKNILRNQQNFHERLMALEDQRPSRQKSSEAVTAIKLPIESVERIDELEDVFENEPATREQLVMNFLVTKSYISLFYLPYYL